MKHELQFLNMPGIEFQVEQERVPLNSNGCDKIQFLISVNPGEPAKPIAKIASGGELSRIMLAIQTVLSAHDDLDTMIFDEVDTGISLSLIHIFLQASVQSRPICRQKEMWKKLWTICL